MEFSVFPVPHSDELTILNGVETLTNVRIGIYNMRGKEIYNKEMGSMQGKQDMKLELALPQGMYFLKLNSDQGIYTQKLISANSGN